MATNFLARIWAPKPGPFFEASSRHLWPPRFPGPVQKKRPRPSCAHGPVMASACSLEQASLQHSGRWSSCTVELARVMLGEGWGWPRARFDQVSGVLCSCIAWAASAVSHAAGREGSARSKSQVQWATSMCWRRSALGGRWGQSHEHRMARAMRSCHPGILGAVAQGAGNWTLVAPRARTCWENNPPPPMCMNRTCFLHLLASQGWVGLRCFIAVSFSAARVRGNAVDAGGECMAESAAQHL